MVPVFSVVYTSAKGYPAEGTVSKKGSVMLGSNRRSKPCTSAQDSSQMNSYFTKGEGHVSLYYAHQRNGATQLASVSVTHSNTLGCFTPDFSTAAYTLASLCACWVSPFAPT